MMTDFLIDGTEEKATFLFAHGAGAGMDSPFMNFFAAGLAARGFRVVRFEFPYMAARRVDGKKRPPDRAPKLMEALRAAISQAPSTRKLIIGGKSMGGRIASMLAAEEAGLCDGLLCLGYPFHPPGKPEKLRTDHLADIAAPTLIIQGERDPFGGRALGDGLDLPKNFQLHWAPDGNHDLSPRKASGHTAESNWNAAMDAIAAHFS
ncbi:alpha/beta fold hydrolase [Kordiimonas sp.]|uniref:alpha/beta fold hydrolase n=1 Tax=Kordiimonas sp. TaxID=1970157 RepID=UPI003A91B86A